MSTNGNKNMTWDGAEVIARYASGCWEHKKGERANNERSESSQEKMLITVYIYTQ